MAIVELSAIEKHYENFSAVSQFDFSSGDGELVVIVGPSGCGKTTTMRIIAGLETASAGRVAIGGRDVTSLAPRERDIAMVFQNYALYPHLNVYGNLAFGMKLRRWPHSEIDRRIRETAGLLGIERLLDSRPGALSGGQRQRVALGRAIVREPNVFLMDEPLSNLDARLRVDMRSEISALCRRLNVTTFYVTHDHVEAMTMADRIVVMRDGRVQQVGTPEHIYDQPANRFVAGFIGSPSTNFLELRVEAGGARLQGEAVRVNLPGYELPPGGRVWLGVRPEHLIPVDAHQEETEGAQLSGTIEQIEPLGAETLLHVRVGSTRLTARVDRQQRAQRGQHVSFRVADRDLRFFDIDDERSLSVVA